MIYRFMSRLTRIELDNFLSFGHIEFDLICKDGVRNHAFVFGENGSGKSNLIRSMSFLQDSMRTIMMADAMDAIRATLDREGPRQFPDDPKKQEMENAFYYLTKFDLSVSPKFQTSLTSMSKSCRLMGSHDPMHMRYEFDTDSGRLSYDMVFSEDGMLTREELGLFTVGRRTSRLFLVESIGDALNIKFGRSVFSAELSRALRRRIPVSWGMNSLLAILLSEFSRNNSSFMDSSVSEHVHSAMAFINDVSVDVDDGMSRDYWFNGMPMERGSTEPEKAHMLEALGKAASSYLVRLYSDIKKAYYETRLKDGRLEYRLVVEKVIAGERRMIPIEQESAGTRKLLGMLPALLRCVSGGVALVDEFDSGVHDRIVHDVLKEILPELQGQLIITTHNTLLLETVDPSDVYVIRSSVDGFKELRTFDSIAPTKRNHHNNRKRYLQGLYDGIPIIRGLDLQFIAERLDRDLGREA